MGPILYRLQLLIMVCMDCMRVLGLARVDLQCQCRVTPHCSMTFPHLFLISLQDKLLCAVSSCRWLLKGAAHAALANQILPAESRIIYTPMALLSPGTWQYRLAGLEVLNANTGDKSSGSSNDEQGCSSSSWVLL